MQNNGVLTPEGGQDLVIGYSVMDNGSGIAILMPHVPGADNFVLHGRQIVASVGTFKLRLADVPQAVLDAQAKNPVLIIGINAFSNPASEHLLKTA